MLILFCVYPLILYTCRTKSRGNGESAMILSQHAPLLLLLTLIILGLGQEVLGAKVGMLFSEIKEILGEPAFGPELGMDNLYYMDYFFGEMNHHVTWYIKPALFLPAKTT